LRKTGIVRASPYKTHGEDGIESDGEIVIVAVFRECVLRTGRIGFEALTRLKARGTILQTYDHPQ
jgi:hypothetical protein